MLKQNVSRLEGERAKKVAGEKKRSGDSVTFLNMQDGFPLPGGKSSEGSVRRSGVPEETARTANPWVKFLMEQQLRERDFETRRKHQEHEKRRGRRLELEGQCGY